MIIVKKSGYLKYKNFNYLCALGKAGIKKKIKEGDNITPRGIFKITKIGETAFISKYFSELDNVENLLFQKSYHCLLLEQFQQLWTISSFQQESTAHRILIRL